MDKKNKFSKIKYYLLALWLFFMMALPALPSIMKLTLTVSLVATQILFDGVRYYSFMSKACAFWIFFFLFTFIISALNDFAFAPILLEIYIIRPIFFLLTLPIIRDEKDLFFLAKLLIYIALFVSIYNLILFFQTLGLVPLLLDEKTLYGVPDVVTIVEDDFFTYRSTNQTALMFLTPFMLILNQKKHLFLKYHLQNIVQISTLLCVFVSITCGRRILQLEVALLLVLVLFFIYNNKFYTKIKIKTIIKTFFFVICISIFVIKNFELLNAVGQTIFSIFNEINTNKARTLQIPALLNLWKQSPLIGNGISAGTSLVGGKASFSYEYFYIALLAQIGIIGIIVVVFYIWNISKKLLLYNKINNNEFENTIITGIFCGFLGFLFCGASNPLVTSSWMWFVVLVAYYYCNKRTHRMRSKSFIG